MDESSCDGITKAITALRNVGEQVARVSVILPVYKVEPYIERCIDSLKAQTMQSLEFIFVDDCSTDASMAAVEAWAAEDGRVRILRNEKNLGTGLSRNRGIGVARGDYLAFADPDDYMAPDFYELLYAAATSGGGHDIAKGRCCKVDGETGQVGQPEDKQNKAIRRCLARRKPLYLSFSYEHWTALWKRTLFDNPKVRYGTSITAQDTTFQLTACFQTNDIVLEDRALYYYVQHPHSATHRSLKTRTHGEVAALDEKASFLLSEGMDRFGATYFRNHTNNLLRRFQEALGKGLVGKDEVRFVSTRLFQILLRVLDIVPQAYGWTQIQDVIVRLLHILPGERSLGEGDVRVSVILPVYNPGEGVHKCIESLRSQLLDGLEFIVIDDCSTDESMAAMEVWAAADSRVRILRNRENLGPGPSRNRGIEEARGDYLSFVDPDDCVSPDFYELLYAAASAGEGHDIAKGQRVEIDAQGKKSFEHGKRLNDLIVFRLTTRPLYLQFSGDHWTAIYKRSLFEDSNIRYGLSRKSEDTTFTLRVCRKTEDIVIEPKAKYFYYTEREGSASNQQDTQRFKYELDGLQEKVEFFEESGFDANVRRYLSSKLQYYLSTCFINLQANPSIADEYEGLSGELERIVGSNPNLRFLQNDPSFQAFVEHHELLPGIGWLPSKLKLTGVSQWVTFISNHPNASFSYLDGCAKTMELFMVQVAGEKGLVKVYSQMAEQMQMLPPQQRSALRVLLGCHLVSARNFRRVLSKAKRMAKSKAKSMVLG